MMIGRASDLSYEYTKDTTDRHIDETDGFGYIIITTEYGKFLGRTAAIEPYHWIMVETL